MEESLLLPTQDVGLFAKTFLLIFAHTFIFIAVAVHFAHPLATTILADIKAHRIVTTDTASSNHSKALSLLAIYLSYLASKLATQLVTSLATATTYSGERLTHKAINKERIGGLLGTAVLAGVLELLLTALLVVLLVSTWTSTTYADSGMKKSLCGYLMLSVALLLYIYLATAIAVSVGVSAVDRGCHSVWALRRAWQLMAARRKEAAVLVFVVNLLPAFIYPAPVYAFSSVYRADEYSLFYGQDPAGRFSLHRSATWSLGVWLMGVVSGSGLPSIGAQLFSMVAATVFCCLSTETNDGTCSPGPVILV